jgi:energy-coupling factor transporter transmembrane protein EcfT
MIRLGQYRDGNSFVHLLDARVKILATIILSILIFQARGWEILLLSGSFFTVGAVARLRLSEVREMLRPLAWLAIIFFSLHLFFTDGTVLLQIPYLPVKITQEGFSRGMLISWQFLSLALGGAILTMTTSPADLVHGLEHLLSPLKYIRVPVQDIAVMVSMALRFVPTLLEEYDRIKTAQAARGADVETGRYDRKLKFLAALFVPLLVSAFRRADDLAEAMEARGYARGPRTTLRQLRFGQEETVALIILGVLLSLFLVSKYCFCSFLP